MNLQENIIIHKPQDFEGMRKAGRLAAEVLDQVNDIIKPGITTDAINTFCHDLIVKNGAIPAPLNYRGFPKSICTSVNHVVCHGIPSDKKLKEGDIVNIDVTVIVDGWHGDTSRMYYIGKKLPLKATRLVEVTYECMMLGIEAAKPGVPFKEIGRVIQEHAHRHNYSVVRDFCGHGIGKIFHSEPNVLHYFDNNFEPIIQEGMFFTVEPMINAGSYHTKILADDWTAVTRDKSLSAQFEHSIGIIKNGAEIFTGSPKQLHRPFL